MEEQENLSPTRQRTVAAIRSAFIGLLRTMPFESITIRNICQAAQVSKFTFYNYYCDKYELAQKLQDEFIGGLCDTIETPEFSEQGNRERDRAVYEYVSTRAEEYHALTTLTLDGVNFNQRLLEGLRRLTQKQIEDGVRRSGRACTREAAIFFSHTMASNEIAEIEIIANNMLSQEALAHYQREAAKLNEILLNNIRKF